MAEKQVEKVEQAQLPEVQVCQIASSSLPLYTTDKDLENEAYAQLNGAYPNTPHSWSRHLDSSLFHCEKSNNTLALFLFRAGAHIE